MKPRNLYFVLLLGLGMGLQPVMATVVRFEPANTQLNVGEQITINMLADIGTDEPVIGFDLNLGFNSSLVSLLDVQFGSAWEFSVWSDNNLFALAPYDIDQSIELPVTGNDVLLASLTFNGNAFGNTDLTALFDANQGFALQGIGEFAALSVIPGNLQVVPLSPSLAFLLPGLFGVGMMAARRRDPASKASQSN